MTTLFRNHFDSPKISDNELQKFSEDHLARLTNANTGGVFDPIVTSTGSAHIAYFGAISNEDVASAVKEGLTINVNNAMDSFKKLVQQKEGTIRGIFGKESAEYQEFFPHGLSEYTNINKETAELLMNRMATSVQTHAAVLDASLTTGFPDMRSVYKQARTAQLGKKGEVSDHKTTSSHNRTRLELQLTANIHFIGWHFPGDTQKCLSFFDQSFLRDHAADHAPAAPTA